jgi:Tol biopolymer transport system component
MRTRPLRSAALAAAFFVSILAFSASDALAQKRSITEKDLFDFVWIGDPQVRPDGSARVVRARDGERKEGRATKLRFGQVGTRVTKSRDRLTRGDRDSSPRWSPDGGRLCSCGRPRKTAGRSPASFA